MDFRGKSAIVTGSCSGIGLEAAKELLKRGIQVIKYNNRKRKLYKTVQTKN